MAVSQPAFEPALVVVMGVSGCGKTSVGEQIAAHLGVVFIEGDTLHPGKNVEKMAAAIPLSDEDRWPWLDLIGKVLRQARDDGQGIVVTCSALKASYRDRLRNAADAPLFFVFLNGSRELLRRRIAGRRDHFFPPALLDSQLATLERPDGEPLVITVNIDASTEVIAETVLNGLGAFGISRATRPERGRLGDG